MAAAPTSRPRFEHYQTATHVTVVLWVKGATSETCSVTVAAEKNLQVSIRLPSGSEFALDLDLFAKVKGAPAVSIFGTKVEVRLEKDGGAAFMWPALEAPPPGAAPPAPPPPAAAAGPVAVTSSEPAAAVNAAATSTATATGAAGGPGVIPVPVGGLPAAKPGPLPAAYVTKKDWSKVEREIKKEEEEEKPEGEEALHKLFRSIYSGADEDTRRAMVKSFQTSGGKVLSTNWGEVSKKDYEREELEESKKK